MNNMVDMTLCLVMLRCLLLLSIPAWILTRVNAHDRTEPDGGDVSTMDVDQVNKDLAVSGGLRWSNLGVSFEEPCEHGTSDDDIYVDNSLWLLHPSSGFVEKGTLCGILGPSGKKLQLIDS
jgi:hypothetical protein